MKLLTILLTSILSTSWAFASLPSTYMAVANRSDSSISLIDTTTDQVVKTISSQSLGYEFEPMYASHVSGAEVFVVGDRKNNELMIFDDRSGELLKRQPLSAGVFHQWAKPGDTLAVVATDIEKGADLIDIQRDGNGDIKTQKVSFRLSGEHQNGKPHDVVIDAAYFYLTIHDTNTKGINIDKVLKVSRKTLEVVAHHVFSPDVHVGLPQNSPYLLVAEQSGKVNFLTRQNMKIVKTVKMVPGAHGIYWNPEGTQIYSANIASDGPNSLYSISNQQLGSAQLVETLDSGFSKPHNIAVDFVAQRLYLTHSGANDVVSVYDIQNGTQLLGTIQTGANPFGIGFIKR